MPKHKCKFIIITTAIIISCIFCISAFSQNTAITADSTLLKARTQLTNSRIPAADLTGTAQGDEILSEDELIARNDNFELYVNPVNLILKLKDLSNGYVWSSAPKEDMMDSLNDEWRKIATSLAIIEYFNASGSVSRSSLKYGSENKPKITKTENGFSAQISFSDAGIELTVNVELKDYGINISIPDESIVQTGKNTLHKLYVMPFFGAVRGSETPGYVLIPDGSGALIRFSRPRSYISTYSERVYGYDLGMTRLTPKSATVSQTDKMRLSMPVFGISHGSRQNAFLAVTESGDEYMNIIVNPAGSTVDFTWSCASFVYRDQYVQPTTKAGSGFTTMQPHTNPVNLSMDYIFLSGEDADYVGMAKAYRARLRNAGMLNDLADDSSPIKLKVEALMAEPAKGLIGSRLVTMTRISDIEKWIDELEASGVANLSVVLWGYEKGGASGHKLDSVRLESAIGTKNQLKALKNKLSSRGNELILRKEIQRGYERQVDRSLLSYHIDGGVISQTDASKLMFNTLYYQNIRKMQSTLDLFARNKDVMENLALTGIPANLFSDFRRNNEIYRNEAKDRIIKLLETAGGEFNKLALYDPNVYALKYADAVYDIPMQHSQFAFETDTVPFVQIVLSGSIEYYAPPLNFGTNNIDDILRLIDYGAYPSYVLTEEYSSELAATNLNYIYSSQYSDWKDKIAGTYKYINSILSQVKGKSIVKRLVPEDGKVIVEYEGGTTIAVNYTDTDWNYENEKVPAKSAIIVR
ncbi:MAG TPA: hypothetical protein GX505_09595 [Clostridiales bacterium]|nr:hypothetical protein [Clostridiales bacterium]